MKREFAVDRILIRMWVYGMVLGSIAGVTLYLSMSIPLNLGYSGGIFKSPMPLIILPLFIGLLAGGVAGFFSGCGVIIVTEYFLPRQITPRVVPVYRFVGAIITMVVTSTTFLPFILFGLHFGDIQLIGSIVIFVGIGIYCSQLTIAKYLRETDVRKRKHKAN